jgi:hypothetical protein|mmetsp:Transcript_8843/g.16017  ORF Transcript_8843/g.16017 Transcript_8843/m.16017 type:complete len:108 (-) Transcript_8843:311-634(-)
MSDGKINADLAAGITAGATNLHHVDAPADASIQHAQLLGSLQKPAELKTASTHNAADDALARSKLQLEVTKGTGVLKNHVDAPAADVPDYIKEQYKADKAGTGQDDS